MRAVEEHPELSVSFAELELALAFGASLGFLILDDLESEC